ncbi:unnamed protein product, partial [Candidula unifasciata]
QVQKFALMCIYRAETRNRTSIAQFNVKDINFTLCTHYLYAYGCVNSFKLLCAASPELEEGPTGYFRMFNDVKKINPSTKTLLSIGGPSLKVYQAFTSMSDAEIYIFAKSALLFLRHRDFDGLDIDLSFPHWYHHKSTLDKTLQLLRREFDKDTVKPCLLLTLTASGLESDIQAIYNVESIKDYVDYVLVKSYNLYLPQMSYTHFNSPLYTRRSQPEHYMLNMNFSIHFWSSLGMPFDKLVVGLTGVGRFLQAPITNTILRGSYYKIPSGLAYPEVCLMKDTSQIYFDDVQKCPYLVRQDTWVGYDDVRSIQEKLSWMTKLHVAGVMFAGLDEDDFTGTLCQDGKYPLLNYIKAHIQNISTTLRPSTQAPQDHRQENNDLRYTKNFIIFVVCCLLAGLAVGLAVLYLLKQLGYIKK